MSDRMAGILDELSNFAGRADVGSITPEEPGYRDMLEQGLGDLFGGDREDHRRARKLVGVLDFLPGFGEATGAADTVDSYNEGDYVGTGINGLATLLGVVPVAGDALAKGLKSDKVTELLKPRTYEEAVAAKHPDFGEIIQTRKAGESVEVLPLDQRTVTGAIENPISSKAIAGEYGDLLGKAAITKQRKLYETNPVFAEMQDLRLGGGRFRTNDDLYAQSAKWEDLIDRPLIHIPADMSSVGVVDRIAGRDIEPIQTEGGALFADKYNSWMSMMDAAKGKQLHAMKVADKAKQLPIGLFQNMNHPGSNFSTMPSEGILNYIEAMGGLGSDGVKAIDDFMLNLPDLKDTKNLSKEWPGYEGVEQMRDYLFNPNSPGSTTLGNRRKAFVPKMLQADMQKYGIMPPNDLYAPINEQIMRDLPGGHVGFRGGLFTDMDPKDMQAVEGVHRSYNTPIPLETVFAMEEAPVPWRVVFDDAAKRVADKPTARANRSFQTSGSDYQMFREEDYNRVMDYYKQILQE